MSEKRKKRRQPSVGFLQALVTDQQEQIKEKDRVIQVYTSKFESKTEEAKVYRDTAIQWKMRYKEIEYTPQAVEQALKLFRAFQKVKPTKGTWKKLATDMYELLEILK